MSRSGMMSNNNQFDICIKLKSAIPLLDLPTSSASTPSSKQGKEGERGETCKTNVAQPQPQWQQQQLWRKVLRVCPSSSPEQFFSNVFELFGIPIEIRDSYQIRFFGGYPRKELNHVGKSSVCELGIRPRDCLEVEFLAAAGENHPQVDQSRYQGADTLMKLKYDNSAAVSNTVRPKRVAAIDATARFQGAIAAQDDILNNQRKSTKKKTSTASKGGNSGRKAKAKKGKMEGEGYRLSDGKVSAGSETKNMSVGFGAMRESTDDIAISLVRYLSGDEGKGVNAGKCLQTIIKEALEKSYGESLAAVRVSAVNRGEYHFEKVKGGTVVDGGGVVLGVAKDYDEKIEGDNLISELDEDMVTSQWTVSYSKGIEGRGMYEEQMEIVPWADLKGMLELLYTYQDRVDMESDEDKRLRPAWIARLSPELFWSMVYHCGWATTAVDNPTHFSSVEDMLRKTLPQLDWSHLSRGGRKRLLSDKAKENLKQERDTKLRKKIDWELVTPVEEDIDELIECIRYGESVEGECPDKNYDKETGKKWAGILLKNYITNWRVLANSNVQQILSISFGHRSKCPSQESVETWIGVAQERSNEEIMLEILDVGENKKNANDALEALALNAHVRSPRDMMGWESKPGVLLKTILAKKWANKKWTESDVVQWISRARTAVDTCTWLDDFIVYV